MIQKQLKEYLDHNGVKYTSISHSQAFTAQEIAEIAHIPGKEIAKTVMVKLDGAMKMAVLPASDMVDFKLLRASTGASTVELASETEFRNLFPQCEVGAMPPFGNLFNVEVLSADDLAEDREIVFNAGTHNDLIKMPYTDFVGLVHPKVMRFSVKKRTPAEEDWKYQ